MSMLLRSLRTRVGAASICGATRTAASAARVAVAAAAHVRRPVSAAAAAAAARPAGAVVSARGLATKASAKGKADPKVWRVDNPYTGDVEFAVPLLTKPETEAKVAAAAAAFAKWKHSPLSERKELVTRVIAHFERPEVAEKMAAQITAQMGKPLGQAKGEVKTAVARMKALLELSDAALREEVLSAPAGFSKRITKEPIGVVLALCPWNYPLLCAVNTVTTAVLSGDSVLIKMSDRTPLCADHFADAYTAAGAPAGLVQSLHIGHNAVSKLLAHPTIAFVSFTGSVSGGAAVYSKTAASRFIDVGLELGGKDPAYVAADANVKYAVENVVDGACYNAGQSCCSVERVYVHSSVYDEFVAGVHKTVSGYVLGDPTNAATTLGPLAQAGAPDRIAKRVAAAVKGGATLLCGGTATTDAAGKGRFFAPAVVTGVTPAMQLIAEETFGPVLPIVRVESDEQAVALMNASAYGLTASVWTSSVERADRLNAQLDAGTVFMNRCDFLDPYLPWSGRKASGKGIGLSHHAFANFVRTKGYNYKHTL